MGAPKPALGFVSRTEAIMAMRGEGLSPHQMADRLGIPVKNVAALEFSAKRTDRHPELRVHQEHLVPLHIRQQLRPHAAKRGLSVDRLIGDLVAVIAENSLVDAVLDDGPVGGDR